MTKAKTVGERANLDDESRGIIFQGASVNQLAEMFGMRAPDVMRRLAGVSHVGLGRQGNPIYRVRDAAPRLIKLVVTEEQITEHLRRMNPKELPPLLSKLFWDAMIVRNKYREQAGELWLTTDILEVASAAFQSIRMSLLLIPDRLRDETAIGEAQVLLVQEVIDTALDHARQQLITDLRKPNSRSRSGFDTEDDEPL